MRRITVLASAAAVVAVTGGLIGFGLFGTGTVAPRREAAPPQALAPEAAFSLPVRPEPQPSRTNASASSKPACGNPNALGVSRTVEIDTTGGPGFGFEHFKQHDFLRDKEV